MSEVPPNPEPTPEAPPPQYAAYPRGEGIPMNGSAEKLQALADGYFGLNTVFIINIVLAIGTRALTAAPVATMEEVIGRFAIVVLAMLAIIGFLTYPHNKKIAFGKNWSNGAAILASVLMGLNSALCCGIIGYVVMQTIAMGEIKNYGLKGGFLGLKKKDIQARIDQIRAQQPPMQPF